MADEQVRDETLNMRSNNLINTATDNQYVTFRIGEEEYGIDIMLVQEIIRYSKPTTVFNSNPVIKGVTNFRGKVIPVVNMHCKFNLFEVEYDEYTVVIIIEVNGKTMGMIVDRVSDIMSFNEEDIQEVNQEFAQDIKTEHLKGMAKTKERIIMLLNPEKIMNNTELKEISQELKEIEQLEEAQN